MTGRSSCRGSGEALSALGPADRSAVVAPLSPGIDARKVPKRLRPKLTVAGKRRKFRMPWAGRLFVLFMWLTDVPQELYDRVTDSITLRRKRRPLRGGWRSQAGGLLAACDAPVRTYLAVGGSGVHVVYVGDLGSEIGWTLPREQVRSAEALEWARDSPYVANFRLHFADGSWASVRLRREVQHQMLGEFTSK